VTDITGPSVEALISNVETAQAVAQASSQVAVADH
jgi:NADH-quinone oxidoreductase subunit M